MLNSLANFLDDLVVKLDLLTFRINQRIKLIEEKHNK